MVTKDSGGTTKPSAAGGVCSLMTEHHTWLNGVVHRGELPKETLDVSERPCNRHGRQAVEEQAPVRTRVDARVAHDEHAAVVEAADEPPRALLQRDHRFGQLIFHERIA